MPQLPFDVKNLAPQTQMYQQSMSDRLNLLVRLEQMKLLQQKNDADMKQQEFANKLALQRMSVSQAQLKLSQSQEDRRKLEMGPTGAEYGKATAPITTPGKKFAPGFAETYARSMAGRGMRNIGGTMTPDLQGAARKTDPMAEARRLGQTGGQTGGLPSIAQQALQYSTQKQIGRLGQPTTRQPTQQEIYAYPGMGKYPVSAMPTPTTPIPPGFQPTRVTREGVTYEPPERVTPTYTTTQRDAAAWLDKIPAQITGDDIKQYKTELGQIGETGLDLPLWREARQMAITELGGSWMVGIDREKAGQVRPKTLEIYKVLLKMKKEGVIDIENVTQPQTLMDMNW